MMRCEDSSHLGTATVPSLSLRLLVSSPKGSRTCCTPWSVFQDGSDGPSECRRHWHTGDAHRREITATVCTACSPHRTVHSCREAPPFGVCHGGQGLPIFLGRAGAPYDGAVSCRHGTGPCRLTFLRRLWLRPTAAGPCSRGVRHCLGRTARDDLRHRVGTLGRA